MSKPKILYKWAYFVPAGVTSAQDGPVPTYTDADKLGTVLTVAGAREYEEAIFDTPKGGKWVDRLSVNQRQREVLTVTCNELTPLFWSLLDAANAGTPSGGSVGLVPGTRVTWLGWLILTTEDESVTQQTSHKYWVKLDMPSWEMPQTGYMQATFVARVLDSNAQAASFLNDY